jgi:glycosyltransferase involved in cell wall biosynthesis
MPKTFKVMMVGVVPPPVHGQALATKELFESDLTPIEKFIVPINSSRDIRAIGKFSLSKVFGLIGIILEVWALRARRKPRVLYYTAGSGAWVPFFRDLVFLTCCRPLFKITLIHYHSGNLTAFLGGSFLKSQLGKFIYGRGAWTIRLGKSCPAPNYPRGRVFEIPNGIEVPQIPERPPSESFRILFLGNLYRDKGVIDLIHAVNQFAQTYPSHITLTLAGAWPDDKTREETLGLMSTLPANVYCSEPTPVTGNDKWRLLAEHDVFAFPSYYSSENSPLVIIEAMAAALPVISTSWRGIPSLVKDGETGILVPVRDIRSLSSALHKMASNPDLRVSMGTAGRFCYERSLTAPHHLDSMRRLFMEACTSA